VQRRAVANSLKSKQTTRNLMKKIIALAALVCSASFAKAQYATIRIKDNTGYPGGVYAAVYGDRFPGRPCSPDNISQPPTLINMATYTVFTPAGTVWAYAGATNMNGIHILRPGGDATGIGVEMNCAPMSSRVVKTNFSPSGDPVTATITMVSSTQLDIVLTP
jgi:hypothetical protein